MHIGAMGKSRTCVGILTYVCWQRHIGAILEFLIQIIHRKRFHFSRLDVFYLS